MRLSCPHHVNCRVPEAVFKPRAIHVLVENVAGQPLDAERLFLAEALVVVVPLLQNERQPAALALGEDDPQLRVTFEHAREDHIEERVDGVVLLFVDRTAHFFGPDGLFCVSAYE